jgi:apolipoprotein N-acyltransferase
MTLAAMLDGRRRLTAGLALLAGLGAAVAFPPFGVLPGLLGYGLMMALIDAAPEETPLKSAFWRGWLAGTLYFLLATWWVAEAFMVDAKNQGWMAPFAVGLLAAGLGLFWGGAAVLYRWLKPPGLLRPVVFAGVFCLFEWLRGHILTGLPWDLAGETWRAGSAPSQAAALVGAYGLSWITVLLGAAPALIVETDVRRERIAVGGAVVLAIAALYAFGAVRLSGAKPPAANAPIIRVVQANIDQESKYDQAMFEGIVHRYVTLTAQPAARLPDIIVWPEGAVPDAANDYLTPKTWTRAAIVGALKPGQTLLLGAYRIDGPPDNPVYYNTLLALRGQPGDVALTGMYDKFRLVPFGEYLPLESVLAPLGFKNLVHIGDGFSAGPRPQAIRPVGIPPVQPLICYESLFPGFTREGAAKGGRAQWIANVSNDAWFGRTYGPIQHLNLASYRAIEEGLPMVRATPTGVSAVIDAYGRIRPGAVLGQGVAGVIDAPLPPALPPTLFSRLGDKLFWLFMFLSAAAAAKGRYGAKGRVGIPIVGHPIVTFRTP